MPQIREKPTTGRGPEPLETLRARYPDAVREVFDLESVKLGVRPRPGECPRNIFDCEDGCRLIVSREAYVDDGVFRRVLHFSGSFAPGSGTYERIRRRELGLDEIKALLAGRFAEISGDRRTPEFLGISADKGIPHWWIVEEERPC